MTTSWSFAAILATTVPAAASNHKNLHREHNESASLHRQNRHGVA
jgi:hypothetical protein